MQLGIEDTRSAGGMVTINFRSQLDQLVHEHPEIELVIVHHRDGSNDFFSSEPNVVECQRHRVIAICESIARTLIAMPRKRGGGRPQGCPGSNLPRSRAGATEWNCGQ
jgi:hypothetical protein